MQKGRYNTMEPAFTAQIKYSSGKYYIPGTTGCRGNNDVQ